MRTNVKSHYRRTSKGSRKRVKAHTRNTASKGRKVPKRSKVDIIGDQIDRNYKTFIEVNWKAIKENLKDLEVGEDDESPYMYLTVDKTDKYVSLSDICFPDYWQGTSPEENWTIAIPVDQNTTKSDLLDVDASEESYFYEDY